MLTRLLLTSMLVAMPAAQAIAQRTNDNATKAAQDAFGTSVGNERIGLYSPDSARGFDPVSVGNARIDGLYFDQQIPISLSLVSGSTVRVGLTAQGYPFPAPTGIADFSLRKPGSEPALSSVVQYGPYGGWSVELNGELPVSSTLSVGGGAILAKQELYHGPFGRRRNYGLIATWRPTDAVEITPFWGMIDWRDYEDQPIVYMAGDKLPPKIQRGKHQPQDWVGNVSQGYGFGVSSRATFGPWQIRAGLFRSIVQQDEFFWESFVNTSDDGMADQEIMAEAERRFASVSGEFRVSYQLDESDRLHAFHLNLRGRDKQRRYGGGQTFSLGRTWIDDPILIEKPDFNFGPQSHDKVKQLNLGLGYDGRWLGVGQLSLGIQKVSYSKAADRAGVPLPESRSKPWLPSAALNIEATRKLVVYGSYSRGLEESPIAPGIARNAGFAPPAILSTQVDAGLRYMISPNVRLVVGAFKIEKPYYGLDDNRNFTNLGIITNKGLEFSVSGEALPGLNFVVGTMLLDARLSGEQVDQGLVGKHPVGSTNRVTTASIDYRFPNSPFSVDVAYFGAGRKIANLSNSMTVDPENSIGIGGRYRFTIADRPTTLRGQVVNVFNDYNYGVWGGGLAYTPPRRFLVSVTTDM